MFNVKVEKLDKQGNQIGVRVGGHRYFFSYGRCIVWVDDSGQVHLSEQYWDYSRTTSKYRNKFLCESSQETEQKVKSGQYVLLDFT